MVDTVVQSTWYPQGSLCLSRAPNGSHGAPGEQLKEPLMSPKVLVKEPLEAVKSPESPSLPPLETLKWGLDAELENRSWGMKRWNAKQWIATYNNCYHDLYPTQSCSYPAQRPMGDNQLGKFLGSPKPRWIRWMTLVYIRSRVTRLQAEFPTDCC